MDARAATRLPFAQVMAGAGLLLALLVGLKFSSLQTMWHVWGDSNTYTHGYLIFPMVGYLFYLNRETFARAPHAPVPLMALPVIACGLVWVVSSLLNVHVVGQLMFVASLVLLFVGYFGLDKSATVVFPLAYLFFAVPMGEGLVPRLMEFTADFTVWALQATGLPVYRDGMFLSIPAGDFEVAKACSGIRYLMASFALGTLYAYLSFRSFKKQVLFSLMSLVVPILANGIRAYGIVMIAHLSDMKYAVGVDHLVYGWLFFGLVMFILFYIGGKFRSEEDKNPPEPPVFSATASSGGAALWIAVAVFAVALIVPHVLSSYARQSNSDDQLTAGLPAAGQGWTGPSTIDTRFEPNFSNAVSRMSGHYRKGDSDVFVWVYRYRAFDPDHEMITETNTLADLDRWAVFQQRPRNADGRMSFGVIETQVGGRRDQYTVWHWYQLNDLTANGRIRAKIAEGMELVKGKLSVDEALVVVATPDRGPEAVEILDQFLGEYGASLRLCAIEESDQCAPGLTP